MSSKMDIRIARSIASEVRDGSFLGNYQEYSAAFQRLHTSSLEGHSKDHALAKILFEKVSELFPQKTPAASAAQ